MTPLVTRRRWAAVLYEIALPRGFRAGPEWRPGPLPLALPDGGETTREWRQNWIDERVWDALYDSDVRQHRSIDERTYLPGSSLRAAAAELAAFRRPDGRRVSAVLAVHLVPASDGQALLNDLKTVARDLTFAERRELGNFVGGCLDVQSTALRQRNATVLVFATHSPGSEYERQSRWDSASCGWTDLDQWRWALAAASPQSDRALREPRVPATPGSLVRMPRRDVQVLPYGVSMLATRPDTRGGAAAAYDFDLIGTAAIYLDTLILGVCQRVALDRLIDDANIIGDPVAHPTKLRALQREVRLFRNRLWWRDLSPWRFPNAILQAYQEEHNLPRRLDGLVAEVADFAAEVDVASNQRLGEFLGILALLGVPAAVASVLQALHADSKTAAHWLGITAAVVVLPLVVLLVRVVVGFAPRQGRNGLKQSRRRRGRGI